MITYTEARDRVVADAVPGWKHGTFCLDDREIVEDDAVFVFRVGAREQIVDGDASYQRMGATIPTVDKASGEVRWLPGMRLYGQHPHLRRRPNPAPTLVV